MLERLSALERVATDRGLDVLVLVEKEPDLLRQWLRFQEELLNRSGDLGIEANGFRKKGGNKGAKDSSTTDSDSRADPAATRVDWLELCFVLAFQLRTQRNSVEATLFPSPIPRKFLEMWPRKKVTVIAEAFERIVDGSAYGDILSGMRKSAVRWCFTIDSFLSELEEARLGVWKTSCKAQKLESELDPAKTPIPRGELLELMGISIPETNEAVLVRAVEEATQRLQNTRRLEDQRAPENEAAPHTTIQLDSERRKQLVQLDVMLRGDYQTRRELTIERLDVTLQSFTWSKRGADVELQMMEEVQAMRSGLSSEPHQISLNLILATSMDHFQTASECRLQEGAHLRSLVIGPVPDRGGRTDELGEREMQQAKRGQWGTTGFSHRNGTSKPSYPEATRVGEISDKKTSNAKKKNAKDGPQQASASHP